MTIAFDPSLLAQAAARLSAGALPLAQSETGIDFATVMADRGRLDVPTPMLGGLEGRAEDLWTRREMSAPAALRFDEGPLFGRAFLQDGLSLPGLRDAPGNAIFSPTIRDALPIEPLRSDVAVRPAAPRGPKVSVEFSASMSSPVAQTVAGPGDRYPGISASAIAAGLGPLGVRPAGEEHAFETGCAGPQGRPVLGPPDLSGNGPPLVVRPEALQAGRARLTFGSHAEAAGSDRQADDRVAVEKSREFRARFVDRLGPVQVLAWAEDGAVQVSARVALASASAASRLERELRQTVAEDGCLLSGLQINGKAMPETVKA